MAQGGEIILGYASTSRFRPKAAHALFDTIALEDIHRIVGGVTMPNDASIALHEKFGFRKVGVFSANGRKFDRYWDVTWLERPLKL